MKKIQLKSATFLLLFAIFVFGLFNFAEDQYVKNAKAAIFCRGPADVVLVIDRSATMANDSKFSIVKIISVGFMNKLFSTTPNSSYDPYDYHQAGLVAFNNNIDSESLNQNQNYIQGIINNSNGILGENNGYPSDYRRTSIAIKTAKEKLDSDSSSTNPFAIKTMIVLTDGVPYYDLEKAKKEAEKAKDKGVRIISVGLKLDEISGSERMGAENFIKYIASAPSDCYYVSDSGNALSGCVSISSDELEAEFGKIYNDITSSLCNESAPSVEVYRTPSGTLYDVDQLTIKSVAIDDVGFKEQSLTWSDKWPNDIREVECDIPLGVNIECDVKNLGPFATNETINYRSVVKDVNSNEANIKEPNPRSVTVADVVLNIPALFRNKNNEIEVIIFDPNRKADLDTFFITVDAPILAGIKIDKEVMNCSDEENKRTCVYDFNPGCDWTDGITNNSANNIALDVYIYAESSDMGIRQIASSENNILVSSFEGNNWVGTCSDGINNDCDYKDNDFLKPIIDLNFGLSEMLCDISNPIISMFRNPLGNIYDFKDDGVTPVLTTLASSATDSNGIKQNTIYYRENNEAWQVAFDCNDMDADGFCDEDASQSIANISVSVGPFAAGIKVAYYSMAIDYSGNNNSSETIVESFFVKNRSCFGVADLEACIGMAGKCCGEVCNATISNPKNYDTNCAQEVCGDALTYEEDVRVAGKYGKAINFDGVNNYIDLPDINPTKAITVSAWVKSATDVGYSGAWQIISKYNAYILGANIDNGKRICFFVRSGSWKSGSCYKVSDPQNWHHFVGTYDRLTGEKSIFVDGEFKDSSNFLGGIDLDNGPINIGRKEDSGDNYFKGLVDEVYIYNRALDLGEIKNLRDGLFVDSAGLDGYWSFDEEFGDIVHDYSGNGNTGTLEGFPIPIIEPGVLWQWEIDANKNSVNCSINGDSDGCYALGGGCEERAYLCSAGYCGYNSNKDEDHCDYNTGILYNYGCSANICELNPNPAEIDPICDIVVDGNISLNAYDSGNAFISGSSGVVVGATLNNTTDTIALKFIASDTNGISEQKIYWKKSVENSFIEKKCDVLCGAFVDCSCEENIGPFNIGDVIEFYATTKDNSPNKTEETTITYSFEVYDWQCYDLENGKNKPDLTVCGAGKCCGGICDAVIENPFLYHDNCRVESCNETSLFYDWGNEHNFCGALGSCFDYYNGCISGNRCVFGYCNPNMDSALVDSCAGNIFTDKGCADESCGIISEGTDCSSVGNSDGDSIACNCDCNNYDIEEKVYSSLNFDGVDDFVEIPDNNNLDIVDEISVEVWVKDLKGTGIDSGGYVINDNDFVSKIRANVGIEENDGDYDKLSTWEEAIESNLILATSQIFTVSNRGTYDYLTDDGQAITFTGGGTGTLKHLNTSDKVYIINVNGLINAGVVTVDSTGHTFIISNTGEQVGRVIAECYNDWPAGLDDNLAIVNWTTDENHYIRIYTPLSERHKGKVKESENYTGFALVGNGPKIHINTRNTEIDGIILDSTVDQNTGITLNWGDSNFFKISNCIFQNFGVPSDAFYGIFVGDFKTGYILNNIFIKSIFRVCDTAKATNYVRVYNNTFYDCSLYGGNDNRTIAKNNIIYHSDPSKVCYAGDYEASSSNNISSDATAPGINSLINKTLEELAFVDVNIDAEDLHLSSASCARDIGINLKDDISSDIDNNSYLSLWDIGADEYLEGVIISKGIKENAYSLTVSGDGNVYGNINNQSVFAQIGDNNWHQIVMTYNGNNQKLYFDGNETDSIQLVGNININAEDLIIGKGSNGMIDEVRIYNRALYPEEVSDHYNGIFSNDNGLIGHWSFDEKTGVIANDISVNSNNGILKNSPERMKHHHGSIAGPNGNVPENWQVCVDGKNNDCDEIIDDYDPNNTGISNCDGEVDAVGLIATAMDRDCVINPDCIIGNDLFFAGGLDIMVDDVNIKKDSNDFTITASATDDFLIRETIIEWTIDNWASKNSKVCENTGICKVCVEGGTCGENNDLILSSLLSAGNTFSFRVCAWDNSANNNQKCTDYYSITIWGSNLIPEINPLSVQYPNFCSAGLSYGLNWSFNDPDGDRQASYKIQVKKENNNFENINQLVINAEKYTHGSTYQILSADFVNDKEIEYGKKTYYWRVKVTDDRGGEYGQTTNWEEGPSFITPDYKYPQIEFSVTPHYSNKCLYEIGYSDAKERCDFGEDLMFSASESTFIECTDANNKQCLTTNAAKCDTADNKCVSCENNSECVKFKSLPNVDYSCNIENGICEASGSCVDDNDCRAVNAARCDIDSGSCVICINNSQCVNEKFGTTDIEYFCNSEGKCEDREHRKWYFFGDTNIDSINPYPVNNYIESVVDVYIVTLKMKDIMGNVCSKKKNIFLGEKKYPQWNEISP